MLYFPWHAVWLGRQSSPPPPHAVISDNEAITISTVFIHQFQGLSVVLTHGRTESSLVSSDVPYRGQQPSARVILWLPIARADEGARDQKGHARQALPGH